jgi:hypothetical protein
MLILFLVSSFLLSLRFSYPNQVFSGTFNKKQLEGRRLEKRRKKGGHSKVTVSGKPKR